MTMSADEERDPERLLARAQQGDSERLGALLELYRNYLHLLARTQIDLHLQGRASPSDVVQQTFLQACAKFAQFRGGSEQELLAWLRRILVNTLAQLVEKQVMARKRDVRREVSVERLVQNLEDSTAAFEAALASPHSSPSAQAERRELAARVADQLARLPEHYREVIVLRNLEGLPFSEVAHRMKRTAGAVRLLWLRALDQLRQMQRSEELP
jgi:RNA polymerase sigma-70 factor (ECF subfamily)